MYELGKIVNSFRVSRGDFDDATPPPFSKIKVISAVAAVILGWRYAPKLTVTLIASAILLPTVKAAYSWYYPPIKKPPSDDKLDESSQKKDESSEYLSLPTQTTKQPTTVVAPSSATEISTAPSPVIIANLQDVQAWLDNLLADPLSSPDVFPVLHYLFKNKPSNVNNSLQYEPYLASEAFEESMVNNTNLDSAILSTLEAILQDPTESALFLNSPEAIEVANNLGIQPSQLLSYIKEQERTTESAADMFKKKVEEPMELEINYLRVVFSLCAALEKHPAPIEALRPRLKPLTESEEALQDTGFRRFTLQIVFLSRYSKFEAVLRETNPEKFEQNRTRFNLHPLTPPASFGIPPASETENRHNSLSYWVALQAWHTITGENKYADALFRLLKQAKQSIGISLLTNPTSGVVSIYLSRHTGKYFEQLPAHVVQAAPISSKLDQSITWAHNTWEGNASELLTIFSELYKEKPPGLDVISWSPVLPGSRDFFDFFPDDERKTELAFNEVVNRSRESIDFYTACESQTRSVSLKFLSRLLQGEDRYMTTLYTLSLSLKKRPSLVQDFIDAYGKQFSKTEREKLPEGHILKTDDFRRFILGVLWISQETRAVTFVKTRYTEETLKTFANHFEISPKGPLLYRSLLALITQYQRSSDLAEKMACLTNFRKIYASSFEETKGNIVFLCEQIFIHNTLVKFYETLIQELSKSLKTLIEQTPLQSEIIEQTLREFTIFLKFLKPSDLNMRNWDPSVLGSPKFMEVLKKIIKIDQSIALQFLEPLSSPDKPAVLPYEQLAPFVETEELYMTGVYSLSALLHQYPMLQEALRKISENLNNPSTAPELSDFREFLADILYLGEVNPALSCDTTKLSIDSYSSMIALIRGWEVTQNPAYKEKLTALTTTTQAQLQPTSFSPEDLEKQVADCLLLYHLKNVASQITNLMLKV